MTVKTTLLELKSIVGYSYSESLSSHNTFKGYVDNEIMFFVTKSKRLKVKIKVYILAVISEKILALAFVES